MKPTIEGKYPLMLSTRASIVRILALVLSPAASAGANAPTGLIQSGSLWMNTQEDNENLLKSAVIDTANGLAYFGVVNCSGSNGEIKKVKLSNFTRAGTVALNPGAKSPNSAVTIPADGTTYFGTDSIPGIVV